MSDITSRLTRALALAVSIVGLLSTSTQGQSLTRYVPADGLVVLLDHEGFDSQAAAWKGTAAYKMMTETSLGAMFEDIATQLADYAIKTMPGGAPVTGKEVVALLSHVSSKGFAVGYCGSFSPPDSRAGVVVIRDAAKNAVFKKLLAQLEGNAKVLEGTKGRKIWMLEDAPFRWWFEKDDAVFSFVPPGGDDSVIATLDGKTPSALKNPTYLAMAKPETGIVPVGLFFVDLATLPPLPPDATKMGLDGIKRIEARWGIQDKAIVTAFGVQAPRPRRGVLALFDQPALGAGTNLVAQKGIADYTLMSVNPIKFGDTFMAIVAQNDPNSAATFARFAKTFEQKTGQNLRTDILGKIGPRMAVLVPPSGGFGNVIAMWFSPPDIGIVAELKDPKGFEATLDRLMTVANIELKAAGALVPPQAGQLAKPGTAFAEFRKVKAPERGYMLSVPPSVLPTPTGLRPTILIDLEHGRVAMAGSLATARKVLPALTLNGPESKTSDGRNAIVISQSDPSGTLPELLVNLPSLVQLVALAANNQPNRPRGEKGVGEGFRLEFDPDRIPDPDAIRKHLFPSKYAILSDADSIRFTSYSAFPVPIPQLNAGMETPVLIGLLLPAVQAAREAARRSQCVNNEKQIVLAIMNYESANGHLPPPAILDKAGKPLLSWRVAILPFIDQRVFYDQFKLDEPWDSPNNKPLIAKMPSIFNCPSHLGAEPGMTNYRVFTGEGTAFGKSKGLKFADVLDGTSNTIGLVEAKESVIWTKPDDLPFTGDGAAALELAGSFHPGGFNAMFLDGSIRFIKNSIAPNVFKALLTISGGEIIQNDF